jgi:hypothetical protein
MAIDADVDPDSKTFDPEESTEEKAVRLFSGLGQKNKGWMPAFQEASRGMRKHLADHLRFLSSGDRDAMKTALEKENAILMSVFETVTDEPTQFSFPSQHDW